MALPWFEEQPSGGSQALQAEQFPSSTPASSHGEKTQVLPVKKTPQRYGGKSRSSVLGCLGGWQADVLSPLPSEIWGEPNSAMGLSTQSPVCQGRTGRPQRSVRDGAGHSAGYWSTVATPRVVLGHVFPAKLSSGSVLCPDTAEA